MNKRMRLTTLAGAIALAMGSTAVYAAAPAATQLPGQGKVVVGAGTVTPGAIANGSQTITLAGNAVIDWGNGTDINKTGVAGFNIGSAASLTFDGTGAVLNVDVSGNASQIFGSLGSTAGNLYVANANGIIVGAGAQITGSGVVGLIANTLADTSGFSGTVGPGGSVAYNGTGGDVTVAVGAGIDATTVLVSGGNTVNVDLGNISNAGNLFLMAGLPSDVGYDVTANNFTTPGFGTINPNAALNLTGTLPGSSAFGTASGLLSGGDITTSGTVDVTNAPGGATAGGTLTNNGDLTWGYAGSSTAGDVVNNGTINLTGTPDIGGVLTNYGQITGAGHVILANGVDNVGSIDVNIIQSKGDFTNSGEVKVTTAGGSYPAAITVIGGDFSNSGQLSSASGVSVTGGDLTNQGTMTLGTFTGPDGYTDSVFVTNGSIVNQGTLVVTTPPASSAYITTGSDASDPSFTEGADYSITNTGTITSTSWLGIAANDQYEQADSTGAYGNLNGTTGSFTNTGSLQVAPLGGAVTDNHLEFYANNDIDLGGVIQTNDGAGHVKALSASNPLYDLFLSAGSYYYSSAFTSDGMVTVATDITTSDGGNFIAGSQVRLMGNLSAVDSTGTPTGYTDIIAGAAPDEGYAVRVAAGKTITADEIAVDGDQAGDAPNVILQGTLAANQISFGEGYAVGDIFSGPNGGFQLWNDGSDDAYLGFTSTGRIKTAPYLNDANNFRYNFLPVTVIDGSTLHLEIDPRGMTGVPTSGLNLLVNGNVTLDSDMDALVGATGTAVTGVTNVPNSHLVLQSTGNIETGYFSSNFYWPGYIYLGNIAMDADGNALPGTLGLGTITTTGNFNNVLPGDIAGASGIHFITQFPMTIGGNVVTNANAWVNFGTELLTEAYSTGTLSGSFYGGTKGSGSVVNYGPLDPGSFHYHPPVSEK